METAFNEVHVSLSFQTCSAYIRLASVKMFVPRKEFHKIIRKISQNQEEILFSQIRAVEVWFLQIRHDTRITGSDMPNCPVHFLLALSMNV